MLDIVLSIFIIDRMLVSQLLHHNRPTLIERSTFLLFYRFFFVETLIDLNDFVFGYFGLKNSTSFLVYEVRILQTRRRIRIGYRYSMHTRNYVSTKYRN